MNDSACAIPTHDSVDAAFIQARLRAGGHPNVSVSNVTAQRIGTGQIGMCVRYAYNTTGDPDAPTSLIGKFPSDDPLSRETGVKLKNYLKEVSFYRQLQPRLTIRTPRCWYADIVDEGPEFALLLQDMAPATQGNQLEGCAPEIARAAVMELIGLHAPTWNDASLREHEFIVPQPDPQSPDAGSFYAMTLQPFLDRFGPQLEPDETEIIRAYGAALSNGNVREQGPSALIHIDYRLDNLLINADADPTEVTTVDWQSLTVGNPMTDVAYFIGAGLLPEVRRQHEESIVRSYHAGLQAAGITDYDWDDCWRDYRRATFAGFGVTVIASMLVVQTERGDAMFTAMARRHSRHALDLNALELL